ncbi:hypothetical protein [Haloarchaeobius iranensis]|uniref:PGF-CTERM protein n=1 Tax=Haloarchaeobius iranensis TaxID=996166 RepID=A0A1G9V1E1_9EURY|nr:hypothetical protein [Haloarchaeobius iranensis]SDM66044.1 hypothetical protein SAMN05192554_105138 [Haloarchaeobius iranensis]
MPSNTSRVTRDVAFTVTVTTLALAVLTLAGLALSGTVAAVPGDSTAAQPAEPTLHFVGGTVSDDGTTAVDVVLSSAPDGLAGYYLRVAVVDAEVARIEGASYPDRFAMTTDPAVTDDGRSVALEAADLNRSVQPGASNVTLATLSVAGIDPGEVRVTVEPVQFDADDGRGFEPATEPGVVTVTTAHATGTPVEDADGSTATAGVRPNAAPPGTDADPASADGPDDAPTDGGSSPDGGGVPTIVLAAVGAAFLVVGLLAGRRL